MIMHSLHSFFSVSVLEKSNTVYPSNRDPETTEGGEGSGRDNFARKFRV